MFRQIFKKNNLKKSTLLFEVFKYMVVVYLSVCGGASFAQNRTTISGFISDVSTKEVLINANIYSKNYKLGTTSNEYGFYSLTFPSNDSILIWASFIGYESKQINFQGNEVDYNIYLSPGINIGEVNVRTSFTKDIHNSNFQKLSIREVKKLPNLFGEVDIIKTFQYTTGVQSGGEGKSDLFVRGGSPDQNLILLDDVPLYYIAHLGGFFSVFNADAINDVKLYKSGFPARYGSRLSSVLEVRMKNGNKNKFVTQGTLGLLSSKISFEGPIIKDKASFIVSARKNLFPIFKIINPAINYNFYDLNAKVNWSISDKDQFYLSMYAGDDQVSEQNNADSLTHQNKLVWGNQLLSAKWNHIFNSKMFSNLTVYKSRYYYNQHLDYSLNSGSYFRTIDNDLLTGVNDFCVKLDVQHFLNSNFTSRFGLNVLNHEFVPNDESLISSGSQVSTIKEIYNTRFNAMEYSGYYESDINWNKFFLNLGLRASLYQITQNTFESLEPRLNIVYNFSPNISMNYSYSRMTQYIHLLSFSGVGIPSDYWMPTTTNVPPEQSVQHNVGFKNVMFEGKWLFSFEAYHKKLSNLITYKPGESLMGNLNSWEDIIEKEGAGDNYGLELALHKKQGKLTGWAGMTISKAYRQFQNINQGQKYPFKYDRLFDFNLVGTYAFNKNVSLSGVWKFGSGYPFTLATQHYHLTGYEIYVYPEKNSYRMNNYHRLDVALNHTKKKKWGSRTWSVSIYNVYNRKNPYYYYYDRKLLQFVADPNGREFYPEMDHTKLYQQSLFSFLPSFSYSFKF
ncbi:MAG: carboxypeptidase-like regulatory domain-containing protein [Prolixibacteraceae bacterium]